jgi:hypothetical protein
MKGDAMKDRYSQIHFLAANYSRLQGLRMVPVGLLVLFVAIWINARQGDLGSPILAVAGAMLLYWLTDRYYNSVFGRVIQTPLQLRRDLVVSVTFSILAMLAFMLDTAEILSISALGLIFAGALLVDFWLATRSVQGNAIALFPENFVAALVILALSILPVFSISWWQSIGFGSQVNGILAMNGMVLILAGIWGHIRITRDLSAGEAKSDDITL